MGGITGTEVLASPRDEPECRNAWQPVEKRNVVRVHNVDCTTTADASGAPDAFFLPLCAILAI